LAGSMSGEINWVMTLNKSEPTEF